MTFAPPPPPPPPPPRGRVINPEVAERFMRHRIAKNARRRARRAHRAERIQLGYRLPIVRSSPCQCRTIGIRTFHCGENFSCPLTRRPVRLHFFPGVDEIGRGFAFAKYVPGAGHLLGDTYEISADEYFPKVTSQTI